MVDELSVVDVGGQENEVLHPAAAQVVQDRVTLHGEAGAAFLGKAPDVRVAPGIASLAPRGHG